ncbi:MAG: oligosaccharide flippase family protein [Pseudomonadota bacterium]
MPKSTFARGVGVLVGGTAGAQLLMVLAAPLLTRLYTPEDFGLLAVFTALLALLTVIASGRYELGIPLPKSDQDAANITLLSLAIVVFVTAVALAMFLIWPHEIANAVNAPELAAYLWLIPFGVFFVGCYQVFNKWAVRSKQFGSIAKTRIYQSIGTLAIQIGGFKFGAPALLGGHAAGQGVGATGLAFSALKRPEFRRCTPSAMWGQARRYRDFPIYSTWTGLFNAASLQLAPILFVALFGASVAGLYALTLRILSMPGSLIGNAVGSVFLSEAPEARRNGTLPALVTRLHSRLAMVGALPLAVLLFFGPELFAFVFGEQWRQAGVYARWMAPWIYLQFQWSPLSMLASVLELQKAAMIAQFLTLFARVFVVIIFAVFGASANWSIFAFAVVSAICYMIKALWFFYAAGCDLKKYLFINSCVIFTPISLLALLFFLH